MIIMIMMIIIITRACGGSGFITGFRPNMIQTASHARRTPAGGFWSTLSNEIGTPDPQLEPQITSL